MQKNISSLLSSPSQVLMTGMEFHSGPLPSANELAKYERVLPGIAERILVMSEKEQSRRLSDQKLLNSSINFIEVFGTISTTIIVSVSLIAGTFLIINDMEATGIFTLIAGFLLKGLPYGIRAIDDNKSKKTSE